MHGRYRGYEPSFQIFMDGKMRDAEEAARREYDELIRGSYPVKQSPAPQMYQPQQPSNQNNAIYAEVPGQKEAEDYPINKDGDAIFLMDENSVFCKRLNIGTGLWGIEIFDRRVEAVPEEPMEEPEEPDKMDLILERLDTMSDEIKELKKSVAKTPAAKPAKETKKEGL